MRLKDLWVVFAAAAWATGCAGAGAETRTVSVTDGAGVYSNYCAACHRADGSGREGVGAPSIAGLPAWYVKSQLAKFRNGVRGTHIDDAGGMKMRPMALALHADVQIENVTDYVASLPVQKQPDALHGGVAADGAAVWPTCAACHGSKGEGMQALGGPPLSRIDDWYSLVQLRNFKSGARGRNPKDATGQTMSPMAAVLADEQAMKDVIAHVRSFAQ